MIQDQIGKQRLRGYKVDFTCHPNKNNTRTLNLPVMMGRFLNPRNTMTQHLDLMELWVGKLLKAIIVLSIDPRVFAYETASQ